MVIRLSPSNWIVVYFSGGLRLHKSFLNDKCQRVTHYHDCTLLSSVTLRHVLVDIHPLSCAIESRALAIPCRS